MKTYIYMDEYWPMYGLDEDYDWGTQIELTSEELKWIKAITKEFGRVQDFLEKKYIDNKDKEEK